MTGCRCAECWGFKEAIEQITGREHPDLPAAHGHRSPVAAVDPLAKPCDGTMTCTCQRCEQERHERVHQLRSRPKVRQPWEIAA